MRVPVSSVRICHVVVRIECVSLCLVEIRDPRLSSLRPCRVLVSLTVTFDRSLGAGYDGVRSQ